MADFIVQALKTNELSEAWPIVRSGPYPNVDWWLFEAAEMIANGGGVLVARAPDGRIHGVATFEAPANAATVLTIRLLISLELSRSAPARAALLKSLERIARRLDCSHVILPLAGKFALRPPRTLVAAAH